MHYIDSDIRERTKYFDQTVANLVDSLQSVYETAEPALKAMIPEKLEQVERLSLINANHSMVVVPNARKNSDKVLVAMQRSGESLQLSGDYRSFNQAQRPNAVRLLVDMLSEIGLKEQLADRVSRQLVSDLETAPKGVVEHFRPLPIHRDGFTGSLGARHKQFVGNAMLDVFLYRWPITTLLVDYETSDRDIALFHELVHVDQQLTEPVISAEIVLLPDDQKRAEREACYAGGLLVKSLIGIGREITDGMSQLRFEPR